MTEVNESQTLLLKRYANDVAVVVLNRPHVRNALDRELVDALATTIEALAGEPAPPVLILTGAGTDAFCAGADLRERVTLSPTERGEHTRAIAAVADALESYPTPTIAAVSGFALAGGAELALACDMRIAATSTSFGFPEVKIGIFPGAGGVLRLPKLVGPSAARGLLFTGRRVDVDEALRIGLIDRIVPDGAHVDAALETARQIAANAPLALRFLKRALHESSGLPDQLAAEIIARHRERLDDTEDYAEGLAAFVERRPPRFVGR